MEAWKKEQLTAAGVDVHGALERFMGNEALLERMLQRFTGDANYAQLLAAADQAGHGGGTAGGPYVEGDDREPVDDGAVSAVHPPGGAAACWGPGRGLCHAAGDHTGL